MAKLTDYIREPEGAYAPVTDAERTAEIADRHGDVQEAAPYFDREQIEKLSESMTMGDTWRAVQASDGDRQLAGMLAFHEVAKRTGLVPRGSTLDDFLDRVRQDDFVAVMSPEVREGK